MRSRYRPRDIPLAKYLHSRFPKTASFDLLRVLFQAACGRRPSTASASGLSPSATLGLCPELDVVRFRFRLDKGISKPNIVARFGFSGGAVGARGRAGTR